MKAFIISVSACFLLLANAYSANFLEKKSIDSEPQIADAPLFRDPITDGAADPCVIYNRGEKTWWMLYTQRRANVEGADVHYCYGTQIGVACSEDKGRSWYYRGTLDLDFEEGTNTFWAPDVVYEKGRYHMFVVYIRGARNHWGGTGSLMHYTSKDMWHWKHEGKVELPQKDVIDPTLMKLPNGTWRMWYKYNSNSYFADSKNLKKWTAAENPAASDYGHEGAKAFAYKGKYWLVVDEWAGMGVYSSDDYTHWQRQPNRILSTPSNRPEDGPSGAHGDVVVCGDNAYIFYFTHPERKAHLESPKNDTGNVPYELRRSSIQVARLNVVDGQLVVEDRNEGVRIELKE